MSCPRWRASIGLFLGALGPFALRLPARQRFAERFQAQTSVGLQRNATGLGRVKGFTFSETSLALGNNEFDPVVKSCRRVPTARIKSASLVRALAAVDPVTPTEPNWSG